MDIYVVLDCAWRDGATVIGAATDREGAERVADEYDQVGRITGWTPWRNGIEDDRFAMRDALNAEGIHPSIYQEIVVVPLAGVRDVDGATFIDVGTAAR